MSAEQKCFLALDLELNTPRTSDGLTAEECLAYKPEIIEVGISVGMWPSCSILYTHAAFINTGIPLFDGIKKLTGITDEELSTYGTDHQGIKDWLEETVEQFGCFCNPVTWGKGDADSLKSSIKEFTGEKCYLFGRREIDVKTIFTYKQLASKRAHQGGLKSAMGRYGLQFEGTPHRAACDAENTLRLFFHFMNLEAKTREGIENLGQLVY